MALAQSRRWSRYLSAQPRNDARGLPPGALRAPPRPALPLAASSRSKFGGDCPPAVLGAARGARGKAGWSARDPRPSRRAAGRQPSRGQLSPGTFSAAAAAGACVCEAVAPPARRSPPFSPAPPPAPARALLHWGALARERLLPPRGSTADQCDRPPPLPAPRSPGSPSEPLPRLLPRGTRYGAAGAPGTRVPAEGSLLSRLPTTPEARED